MSKRGQFIRDSLIIKKLEQSPYSSMKDLQAYVEKGIGQHQWTDDELLVGISDRTFSRVIGEIRKTYGIEITYCRKHRGYHIEQNEYDSQNVVRLMEQLELFTALQSADELSPFISREQREPIGTDNIHLVLRSIKDGCTVTFSYHKFWEDEVVDRTVEPIFLKEFKNRWYLIAKDTYDARVKCFALDRVSALAVNRRDTFARQDAKLTEQRYKDCFGIILPSDGQPEEVVLSFTSFQGKYIKSLPLHGSQKVLVDDDNELRVSLHVYITHDLVMELLSFGAELTVLGPASLREQMKEMLYSAAAKYDDNENR